MGECYGLLCTIKKGFKMAKSDIILVFIVISPFPLCSVFE